MIKSSIKISIPVFKYYVYGKDKKKQKKHKPRTQGEMEWLAYNTENKAIHIDIKKGGRGKSGSK